MPEIKEIRRFAEFIKKKIKNKYIKEINILDGRYKKHGSFDKYNNIKKKLPIKVIDVNTKGKLLYIQFENDMYLLCTHGLSGGWTYLPNNSKTYKFSKIVNDYAKFESKKKIDMYIKNTLNHLNIEFVVENGSLYYFDMLSFGTMKIIQGLDELDIKLKKIGPDIMEHTTDYKLFKDRIQLKNNLNKAIGLVIMDQKIISGIGNYLRSDILYKSKVNPFREVVDISNKEMINIFKNSKILTWGDYDKDIAIKNGIINSKTKLPSNYNRIFYVYNQKLDIYGNKIIKKELYTGSQKRFIYFVPSIQK